MCLRLRVRTTCDAAEYGDEAASFHSVRVLRRILRPVGDQRGAAAALPLGHRQGEAPEAHYDCTEPAHLSPDLTTDGFYTDSKLAVIDPGKWKAYAESSGPYKKLGEAAIGLEDSPV
jgi:hypothetical protein